MRLTRAALGFRSEALEQVGLVFEKVDAGIDGALGSGTSRPRLGSGRGWGARVAVAPGIPAEEARLLGGLSGLNGRETATLGGELLGARPARRDRGWRNDGRARDRTRPVGRGLGGRISPLPLVLGRGLLPVLPVLPTRCKYKRGKFEFKRKQIGGRRRRRDGGCGGWQRRSVRHGKRKHTHFSFFLFKAALFGFVLAMFFLL